MDSVPDETQRPNAIRRQTRGWRSHAVYAVLQLGCGSYLLSAEDTPTFYPVVAALLILFAVGHVVSLVRILLAAKVRTGGDQAS